MLRFWRFLFFIFFSHISFSQTLVFDQFLINKEKPGTKYNLLYFDISGMMWVGTSDGLYQYDGEDFLLYTINKKDFNNEVTAICQGKNKILWVGYKNGKVAFLKGDNLKIFSPQEGLPTKSITSLLMDKRGILWITTAGEGVYFLLNNRLYNINTDDGLSDNYTYKAIEDNYGNIWIGTDQGISLCKAEVKNKIVKKISYQDGLPDEIIRSLFKDTKGNIWIGTQDKGICMYDSKQNKIETPVSPRHWNFGQINSISISSNDWWIATQEDGLINYNILDDTSQFQYKTYGELRFNNINSVAKDKEGNMWAATNSGLIKTRGNTLSFLKETGSEKLSFIHALISDHNNNLIFTPDQQLAKVTFSDKKTNLSKYAITPLNKLIDIVSLLEDSCGYIWIGTMGDGLYRLNPLTGRKQKLSGLKALNNASILSIAARNNEIWMATLGGVIKCRMPVNCNTDQLKTEFSEMHTQREIGNYFVYKVFVDSRNRLWFGTDGKGITCLEGDTYTNYSKKNGLNSDVVYSITEDAEKNIWFSTLDGGVYRFDGKSLTNYTTENGLSDNTASSVIYDGNNHIAIINQHGIDLLDIKTSSVEQIKPGNNFEVMDADLNAIARDGLNNIWIGTKDGIIKFNSHFKPTFSAPVPVIKKAFVLSDSTSFADHQVLRYKQNNISFDFVGIWFTDPERVSYQYMLQGYSKQWVTTKDKRIIFPDLPSGNYVFRLKASAINNFTKAAETSLPFSIKKPLWRELWFRISIVILLTLAIISYLKMRERNMHKLQTLEKEKIKFQLDTLKSQVNPHFLFNSFNTLISIIENDKNIAVEYVENLSAFFRNLVTYRDKDFITLKEEIKLSSAYFFLQQKRFGKNLAMNVSIQSEKNDLLIPPLVTQILIENAVKHNAVSKETPLIINIFTDGDRLVVKNNVNVKRSVEVSTNSGLQNIINRYQLLTKQQIEINKTANEFIVSLPLI